MSDDLTARLTRLFAERFVVSGGTGDPNVAAARAVVELVAAEPQDDDLWRVAANEWLNQRDDLIRERDEARWQLEEADLDATYVRRLLTEAIEERDRLRARLGVEA